MIDLSARRAHESFMRYVLLALLVIAPACVVQDDLDVQDQEVITRTCHRGRFVVPCPAPSPDAEEADPDAGVEADAQVVDCCAWEGCHTCNVDVQECWPGDPAGSECPWWDAVTDAGGPT